MLLFGYLGSLTQVTCINVTIDELGHGGPEEVARDELEGLGSAEVTSGRSVVARLQDFGLNEFVVRNVDCIPVQEESIDHGVVFELVPGVGWSLMGTISEEGKDRFEGVVSVEGGAYTIGDGVVV